MLEYFLYSCILIILSIIVMLTVHQRWKYRSIRKVPGPPIWPIFGSALEFTLNPVAIFNDTVRLARKYGSPAKMSIGPLNMYLVVTEPRLTEFFISSLKYMTKSDEYDKFHSWIGNGLLTSTGSYWQKRRKAITPTFHFRILEQFLPIFSSGADFLVKRLNAEVGNDVSDIYPYVTAYTLDSICETAMGVSIKAQEDPDNEYVRAVKTVCNIIIKRSFSLFLQADCLFRLSNDYKIQSKNLGIIHGFTKSVIKKRHEELSATSTTPVKLGESGDNDIGIKKKMVFLDLLLNSTIDGKPLTDNDISEEVDTFMFEGHDTTASAICFTLYELARNPKVQAKAYQELAEYFHGNKNAEFNITDLNNLKYMELVIKEGLRLYPSVPIFGRKLTEDAEFNGIVYPKDLQIVFFPYIMHRTAELFENPEQFIPERHLPGNMKGKNAFSYVPFSAGPRNCIGQKFAMYEMKTVLIKILLNFELSQADPKYDVVLTAEIILKSANGVNLRLKKRR